MRLNDKTQLSVVEKLYYEPSSNPSLLKTLVVSPETAGHMVIDERDQITFRILKNLEEQGSMTFKKVKEITHCSQDELIPVIEKLFQVGIIALNKQIVTTNSSRLDQFKKISPLPDPNKHPVLCVFHMHNYCNLACKYCYTIEGGVKRNQLSLENMKKAVDQFAQFQTSFTTFEFHGGEPTIAFDKIKEVTEYIKKIYLDKGKKFNFSIQTNALSLDDQKIDFLYQNHFSVRVSLDGTESTHNAYRSTHGGSGSYDRIKRNIEKMMNYGISPHFVCVVHKGNYLHLQEMHVSMSELGAKTVRYLPMFKSRLGNNELWLSGKKFLNVYFNLIQFIVGERKKGRAMAILPNLISGELGSLQSKARNYMCMRTACGAGNNMLGIDVNGDIYPCEEMIGNSTFKIGNLQSDTLLDVLKSTRNLQILKRHVNDIEKCQSCPWRQYCHGGCLQKSYAYFGEMNRESEYCDYFKGIYSQLIWLNEEQPNAFTLLKGGLGDGGKG